MRTLPPLLLLLGATLLALAGFGTMPAAADDTPAAAPAATPISVVYQFDSGTEQATRGLRNIRNHLAADPGVRITVVALGKGVSFLVDGAETAGGYPFALVVQDLQAAGVRFEICENTLNAEHIAHDKVLPDVIFVPSGMAELARLQFREHYAYLKP